MLLTDVLQAAGDDQIAIVGGLAAIFLAGGVMYFSYFLGPEARKQRAQKRTAGRIVPAVVPRDRAA